MELLPDGFVGPAEAHARLQHSVWEPCPCMKALACVCLPSHLAPTTNHLVSLSQDQRAEHLGNIISTALSKSCMSEECFGPRGFLWENSDLRRAFQHRLGGVPTVLPRPGPDQLGGGPAVLLAIAMVGTTVGTVGGCVFRHLPLVPEALGEAGLCPGASLAAWPYADTAPRRAGEGARGLQSQGLLPKHQDLREGGGLELGAATGKQKHKEARWPQPKSAMESSGSRCCDKAEKTGSKEICGHGTRAFVGAERFLPVMPFPASSTLSTLSIYCFDNRKGSYYC